MVCALTRRLEEQKVTTLLSYTLTDIREGKRGFVLTDGASTYYAGSIIFAVGLLASDKLGSDGSAFPFIKGFGHHFTKIVPALCGLYAKSMSFKHVAGVRCDANIRLLVDGQEVSQDAGELQLTEYGLSGIPVFQVSRFASMALANGQKAVAEVCFLPEFTKEQLQMSKLVPGVFFCGELLDVDGICGGYNLQWAWSSGYVAGTHAAIYAQKGKL